MGRFVRTQVEVPGSAVLALAGGAVWLVGSAALPHGAGTVVLAVGIAVDRLAADAGDPVASRGRGRGWTGTGGGRVIRLVVVGAGARRARRRRCCAPPAAPS